MTEQSEETSSEIVQLHQYLRDKVDGAIESWDWNRKSELLKMGHSLIEKAKGFDGQRAASTELTDFLFDVRGIDKELTHGYGLNEENIGYIPDIAKKIADHYGANDNEVLGRVLETAKEHIADVHERRELISHIVCQRSFQAIYEQMMETVLAESDSAEQAVQRVRFYLDKMTQAIERASTRHDDGGRWGYEKMRRFLTSRGSADSKGGIGFKEIVDLSKELSSTPEEFEEAYAVFASAISGKAKLECDFEKMDSVIRFTQAADALAKEEGASREQRVAYVQRIVDGFRPHYAMFDGVYGQSLCNTLAERVRAASSDKHPSKAELFVSTATKLAQEYAGLSYDAVNIEEKRGWIPFFRSSELKHADSRSMFEKGFWYIANSKELSGSLTDLVAEEKNGHSRFTNVAQGIGLLQLLGQEKVLDNYLRANRSNPEQAREGVYKIAEMTLSFYRPLAESVRRPGDYTVSNAERKEIIGIAKRLAVKYDTRSE